MGQIIPLNPKAIAAMPEKGEPGVVPKLLETTPEHVTTTIGIAVEAWLAHGISTTTIIRGIEGSLRKIRENERDPA